MSDERKRVAENLLQEAVFTARASQTADIALVESTPTGCGLGAHPAGELDLSERGRELFHELWSRETPPTELETIGGILQAWVEQQDAFDRERNHFLRDFRKQNGFDRRTYSAEQTSEYEAEIERINHEVELRRREAADLLLAI